MRPRTSTGRVLRSAWLSLMLPVFIGSQAAIADVAAADSATTQAAAAAESGSAAPATGTASPAPGADGAVTAPALQGGVQKVQLNLDKLREVGLDLKELLKGLSSLYDEVTAQPVQIITEPEIVGRGIVIQIPVGTMPAGPRYPARKKRVDLAMNQVAPVVTQLKENVDEFNAGKRELDLPADVIEQLQPQIKSWSEGVDATSEQLGRLQKLTQGPPYDQDTIAQIASGMEKNVKALDDTRRQIYKVIRKEGKRRASSKS